MSCVCHAFESVHWYLVVTCWGSADLLALVCEVNCVFVTLPCGILGQVWYLIYRFLIFAVFLTETSSTIQIFRQLSKFKICPGRHVKKVPKPKLTADSSS